MFSRSSSPPGTWRPPRSPACMRTATAQLGGRTRCSWPGTASPPRRGSRRRSPLIARLTWKHDKCLFLKKKKNGKNLPTFLEKQSAQADPAEETPRREAPKPRVLLINRPPPTGSSRRTEHRCAGTCMRTARPPPFCALLGQVCRGVALVSRRFLTAAVSGQQLPRATAAPSPRAFARAPPAA